MKVVQIASTKIRLYRLSQFPILRLRYQEEHKRLAESLHFEWFQPAADIQDPNTPLSVVFRSGRFHDVLIPEIELTGRKVVIRVDGTSEQCETVAHAFEKELQKTMGNHVPEPVLTTDQSVIVSELSIDMASLQNPVFQEVADGLKKSDNTVSDVVPNQITCTVHFMTEEKLRKEHINVVPKELSISRHGDSPDDDGIFESSMPTTSAVHSAVLEELEKRIATETG